MDVTAAVIGAGAWGTTLAVLLHAAGCRTVLWEAFSQYASVLRRYRVNRQFLPGVRIPAGIRITSRLDEACADASCLVVAVPSRFFRQTVRAISGVSRGMPVLIATKGLEATTGARMSQVLREEFRAASCAVLSGPTIAAEVAAGKPAAAIVASSDRSVARMFQKLLSGDTLRLYTLDDVCGVELGGALKNVIAIGSGIIDGFGLGTNTKASYLCRGIREMARLGCALGGRKETFLGLSGMGDLITTSFNPASRNRSFGQAVAEGRAEEFLASTRQAVEGVQTVASVRRLRRLTGVETPIMSSVERIVLRRADPSVEIRRLMRRRLKDEE